MLLDPEQRALLQTQPQVPQPVQRGPVQRMPGTGGPPAAPAFSGIQLPGAGTPVAAPVRLTGQPGQRPGETQVAQFAGSGPPTAPPPGYGAPSGVTGGTWQGKVKGGTGGFVGTAKDMPVDAKFYQPYTFKDGPAAGFTVIFKPNANMKGGVDWEKVDRPAGPEAPGVMKQVGQVNMMPDKEGIMQPQSIAPTGPPEEIFEYKGKLWFRHADGKKVTEYDPDKELVDVPEHLGLPKGTQLPRKTVYGMTEKEAEARAAARRELEKQQAAQDFQNQQARQAAVDAERKARRDKDREVLQAGDKAALNFGEQKAYLRMAEQALDAGIRTGRPEQASLPLRQWIAGFLGKGEQENIEGQELFDSLMAKQVQLSRAGGPADSNFSNADLTFAMKGGPNLGNRQETNRALAARGQQVLEWRENQHKALKKFFNDPANRDKGIEDFNIAEHAPELERVFPQWKHMDAKKWGNLRHGMIYVDGDGQYQVLGKDKPKHVMGITMTADQFKALPAGSTYIDLNGVPQVKLEDQPPQQ